MTIEDDGFETVYVTGNNYRVGDGLEKLIGQPAEKVSLIADELNSNGVDVMALASSYVRAESAIQDALNLMALGDNTQARAVLESYLKEGK